MPPEPWVFHTLLPDGRALLSWIQLRGTLLHWPQLTQLDWAYFSRVLVSYPAKGKEKSHHQPSSSMQSRSICFSMPTSSPVTTLVHNGNVLPTFPSDVCHSRGRGHRH